MPSPHQTRAIQNLNLWFQKTPEDERGGILVLPTGAGKTFTASRFLCSQPLSKGQKVLWLAHTHHLLEQAFLSFDDPTALIQDPKSELRLRVVSGTTGHFRVHAIKPEDDVVVCSIQTAARALSNRHPQFMRFLSAALEGLFVVFDEAHHAPAPTYRRFLFDLQKHCRHGGFLGLTATPTYTDEKKRGWLSRVFPQGIIHQEEPARLMAAGVLSQPILETAKTTVEPEFDDREYANWISTYRDLPEKIIQNLAENRARNNFIADYYANNRKRFGKTIIFADRWYQCDQLRESLISRGVKADVVYSHVDSDPGTSEARNKRSEGENAIVLKRFKSGELDVLINVRMLTEGTDVPDVQSVFLTRQTTSRILLTQMIGRALRGPKFGGTKTALIVSFEDNWQQNINWASYEQLADGIADDSTPEFGTRPPVQTISVGLVRQLAQQLDSINVNPSAYLTLLPIGWYRVEFETQVESSESDDLETVDRLVLVFDNQHAPYESFIEGVATSSALQDFEAAALDLDDIGHWVTQWKDRYFGDIGNERGVDRRDMIAIVRHMAQNDGEPPRFFAFEERQNHDLDEIAQRLFDQRVSRFEEDDFLQAEFDRDDRLWRALYFNYGQFKDHYNGTAERLAKLTRQGIETSQPTYTTPEIIADREPSEVTRHDVINSDGGECICCGATSHLDVDHVFPSYLGGGNESDNLQTLCSPCNTIKGIEHIDYRIHKTPLQTAPAHLDTLKNRMPQGRSAKKPEKWVRFLRQCINYFYKCSAVAKVEISSRGERFWRWKVELHPGNPADWIRTHLEGLLNHIQAAKTKAGYHAAPIAIDFVVEANSVVSQNNESSSLLSSFDDSVGAEVKRKQRGRKEASLRLRVFQVLAARPCTGREISIELSGKPDSIPSCLKDEQYSPPSGSEPRIICRKSDASRSGVYELSESGRRALSEGTVDSDAPGKSPPGPAPWRKA